MNRYFTVLILVMLFMALCLTGSFAQTNWTKYAGNQILDGGAPGSWESWSVYFPYVIFENTTYHMWYIGYDGNNERMGYATSDDGINWTKYSGNPVLDLGPTEDWDDTHVEPGPVLVDGDTLKMWYWGYGGSYWRCGLALSTDGINWIKYDDPATSTAPYAHSDPVLQPGAAGSWDNSFVGLVSILFDSGIYKGWSVGSDGGPNRVGYATSDDGIHWIKYDDPGTTDLPYADSDPVLDLGSPGSWDDTDIEESKVIKKGETYHLWYKASHVNTKQTGYATSQDGIHWTRYAGNPVLEVGPSGTWDDIEASVHSVIYQDPLYKMWYTGYSGGGFVGLGIGYAEDFSQIAHSDSLSLNFSYTPPGSDTLRVEGRIKNPSNNTLQVKAHIVSDDSMVVDSTELTLEQDELWSGEWPVPDTEKTFRVAIKTKDLDSGTIHDGMLWNIERFTTIGLVAFDSYEIIDTIFTVYKIKLSLRNEGISAIAPRITAELSSSDTNVTNIEPFNNDPIDIPAGQTVQTEQIFNVGTKGSPDSLYFNVKIFSNGYHYWSDNSGVISSLAHDNQTLPEKFFLAQNYPNPFNPKTVISWQVGASRESPVQVDLSIFNVLGQKVATLVSGKQKAGLHKVEWDASGMSSGVYYYRLVAGEYVDTKKLVLLK